MVKHLKKSLQACWKEGIPAQVMISTFDYYLIPLAIFLGATNTQIGLLISFPSLVSALTQFFSVDAVKLLKSRLKVLVYGVFFQALLLIPIGILPVLEMPQRVLILLGLVTIYRSLGSLVGPAWGSLVSDYLPENKRGSFFGSRSRAIGISGILGVGFWGTLLNMMKGFSEAVGFMVVFLGAAVFRFISFYYMTRMTDLPLSQRPDSDFTFWMFIRRIKESNFVKFLLYVAGISFATQMSAPFFSVYMLEELKFDYISYMAVHLSAIVAGLIAFPLWGRHADVTGNRRVVKTTGHLVPFIPLLWMFAKEPWQLMIVEFFSGFVWSGFTLCSTNFIYDAVVPDKRVRVLAYCNVLTGTSVFAGAALGGFLTTHLPPINGSSLLSLFALSAVLRLLIHLFVFPLFKEVRAGITHTNSIELFLSVLGIRPIIGADVEPVAFPAKKHILAPKHLQSDSRTSKPK